MKKKIISFLKNDLRTKEGLLFFIALLMCFYFLFQILVGRANIFRYISLRLDNAQQRQILKNLNDEVTVLSHKVHLIEQKDADYIDELLRQKFNLFPPQTYQVKESL